MPCIFECTVSHVAGTRRRIVRAKPVEGHPSRPPLHDADGRAAAAPFSTSTPAIAGALASSTTQAEASRTITTAAIATAALTPASLSSSAAFSL